MTTPQISSYLATLFEGHGLPCVVQNDWVVPNAELPALRALWHPGQSSGRLDVQALVSDGVVIEECFAGVGPAETGLSDALESFAVNSFHVLLAALWGRNDSAQVTTEEWEISGQRYTVHVGNFGTRSSEGVTPHIPDKLFAAIEETIKCEPLNQGVHWFRVFVCNVAGEHTFEALKNNEVWDAGLRCLKACSWEKRSGYYSVRLFVVLRATSS
jgi:hypothetical protein